MILDFKEIPQANKGGGLQDTFELFARDFLAYLGYRIVEDPDRGADGKRDLIVEEVVEGISSKYPIDGWSVANTSPILALRLKIPTRLILPIGCKSIIVQVSLAFIPRCVQYR